MHPLALVYILLVSEKFQPESNQFAMRKRRILWNNQWQTSNRCLVIVIHGAAAAAILYMCVMKYFAIAVRSRYCGKWTFETHCIGKALVMTSYFTQKLSQIFFDIKSPNVWRWQYFLCIWNYKRMVYGPPRVTISKMSMNMNKKLFRFYLGIWFIVVDREKKK